jgi:uncharacterized membrane protein
MKLIMSSLLCGIICITGSLHAADQNTNRDSDHANNTQKAHEIIDKKCTTCHSKAKVDIALSASKNMLTIQQEMEKRGAKLTSNEREVLGIFWKQSKPITK